MNATQEKEIVQPDNSSHELTSREKQAQLSRICHICQDLLQCPLQLCDEGHCVCAKCFAFQMQHKGLQIRCKVNEEHIPEINITWSYARVCGLCKQSVTPRFPGSFVIGLISENNEQMKCCYFCQKEMPLHLLAEHTITCDHQVVPCCCCGNVIELRCLDQHIKTSCSSIPCPHCDLKVTSKNIKVHISEHLEQKEMSALDDEDVMTMNSYHLQHMNAGNIDMRVTTTNSYDWRHMIYNYSLFS